MNLTRRGTVLPDRNRVRAVLPVLIFLCLALLLLSRLNHSGLNIARQRAAEWMSPALQAAMVPLEPVRYAGRQLAAQASLTGELRRLKIENEKLSSWEWRARELERKLADLEMLSKVVEEPRLAFVTSRVIADSSGAFVRSVLIDAGTDKSIKSGHPVINGEGLVGRVIEAGPKASRVLLLTDLNSRVPVTIGVSGVRGVLSGDNGPQPRILFLPQDAKISVGDDVATSGTGGLFPRGLRIGKIAGDGDRPRVELRAHLDSLEYLSVLFFDDPTRGMLGELDQGLKQARAKGDRNPGLSAIGSRAP